MVKQKQMKSVRSLRQHDAAVAGDAAFQGDLVFVVLPSLPKSAKPRANRQLAEGDTKGSRHIVVGGEVFDADAGEVLRLLKRTDIEPEYVGPVMRGPLTVEHPQHEHHRFPADCVVGVLYQRNVAADGRIERARD